MSQNEEKTKLPRVLILGRANVGKSTLFNRLLKQRRSPTTPQPGMTQDWLEARVRLRAHTITLIDTAGVEAEVGGVAEALLSQAQVSLLVVEARAELTSIERALAARLRGHKAIVVANKSEGLSSSLPPEPCFALGIARIVSISALHGRGIEDLIEEIEACLPALSSPSAITEESSSPALAPAPAFSLALIGRPNTGKSTLANRLIEQDRMIVDEQAGTTRNAVALDWDCLTHSARLVDTAGLRKASRVRQPIEIAANQDSLRAIREASLVALVCDARAPFEKQELRLAQRALKRGKPLMVLVNKWDALAARERRAFRSDCAATLQRLFPDFAGLPLITLSALYDKDFSMIFKTAMLLHKLSTRRVATRRVNAWLQQACAEHPPPVRRGRRVVLRYATQVSAAPPHFKIATNDSLERSYCRFLIGSLRRYFDWPGVPIVLETLPKA